jgi:hypothetical protein
MSDQNKHIDRIFQESFKHFEAQPSNAVWDKIQGQLQTKKKRIFPFWLKSAGIAASLLLAFGLGYFLQPNPTNQQNSFTNFNIADAKFSIPTNFSTNFEKANQLLNSIIDETNTLNTTITSFNSEIASNSSSTEANYNENKTTKNEPLQNEEIASIEPIPSSPDAVFSTEEENQFSKNLADILQTSFLSDFNLSGNTSEENKLASLENQIEEKRQFDELLEQNEVVQTTESLDRWFLKPVLSPIFNAGNNASSALGAEVASNSSSGDVSFSYGMQVGYKLNKKWSIRAGINQVNTSYTTEDVIYAPAASAFMPANETSIYGLFSQDYYENDISTGDNRIFSEEGSLNQQMNFVEIPLEVEYALLGDSKFGVSLTGGASTLFLTQNALVMNTSDGGINIGEAQNINQTSFSTNIGLGINYRISKKLQFNVEPAFKYQINTFRGSNLNFNPYFFGVYSGLQFQF